MPKLNISVPGELKRKLDQRLAGGENGDVSEYVGDLIRQDLARSPDLLERLLIAGLKSGRATRMTGADWDSIRHESFRRGRKQTKRKAG